jgi:hypothetical protein
MAIEMQENKETLLKCGMWKNLKHGTSFDGSFFFPFLFSPQV